MTPQSWAIALADSIMKRNPGTPRDMQARWSYLKGYTLRGFEMQVSRGRGAAHRRWAASRR
jgi:hypothetical protein